MKVLIGCEYSGNTRNAFRELGHDAWSCDLIESDDKSPFHIVGDVLEVIASQEWDMLIAHPPCTFLTYAAKGQGEEFWNSPERKIMRDLATDFFLSLYNAKIPKICVENPVGHINSFLKPTQTVHPYFFGDPHKKRTCLWLKGLPKLKTANTRIEPPQPIASYVNASGKTKYLNFVTMARGVPKNMLWKVRSTTFPGISRAMAEQWSNIEQTNLFDLCEDFENENRTTSE